MLLKVSGGHYLVHFHAHLFMIALSPTTCVVLTILSEIIHQMQVPECFCSLTR